MIVAHLELRDYRNYREASLSLSPGVTVIIGPNGQGKTNLVEAIGVLAAGSSHRVSGDQALVRAGEDRAILRARLSHGDRAITIEAELNRTGANRLQVNGQAVRSREARRYLDSVLFAPEDLAIVRGEPGGRRRFLDDLLSMRQPRMVGVLSDYERVLRQRNTLLKSARATRVSESALSTLDVWDERLADLGADIVAGRAALVAELGPHVARAYQSIAGAAHEVGLSMESTAGETPETFLEALRARRSDELDRAMTLVGPHRDDLVIELNAMPARTTASHGESWSTALALKLASAELLRQTGPAGDPVLVLDDVFAELDAGRRARLVDAVAGYEQVLVTAAVEEDLPPGLVGTTIRIRAGEIVETVAPSAGASGENASG
ncbi:MAG TPA: DNA replication/repair protein RecF [Microbacteriaceae bacterium]|nr:DNA replication/repair protein RecF [Microbacteriaceae bacterium]